MKYEIRMFYKMLQQANLQGNKRKYTKLDVERISKT